MKVARQRSSYLFVLPDSPGYIAFGRKMMYFSMKTLEIRIQHL